jgi:phytoene dehydrogenase-like protein
VHAAVKWKPKYKVGGDVERSVMLALLPETLEEMLRIFDGYNYGEFCPAPMPMVMFPTYVDKTRAPEGMHTAYLAQYSPYKLKGHEPEYWDEVKEEKGDKIWQALTDRCTNMGPDAILARKVMSPIDKERWNPSLMHGDVQHIGLLLSKLLTNRPLTGWGHYKTPIQKLYMCGASTHPAGGIAGGGRAAVQTVMEDLGIDFKKVINK